MKDELFTPGPLVTREEIDRLDTWLVRVKRKSALAPSEYHLRLALACLIEDATTQLNTGDTWGLTTLTNALRSTVAHVCLRMSVSSPYTPAV